jgi:formylglycine-generating enzyme required for sulfatase activity
LRGFLIVAGQKLPSDLWLLLQPRLEKGIKTMKIMHLIAVVCTAIMLVATARAQSPLEAPAMVTVRGEDTGIPELDILYSYQIGRFEVSGREYVTFLNAVAASDPHGLYHPAMGTDMNFGKLVRRSGEPGSYTYQYQHPEKMDYFGRDGTRDLSSVNGFYAYPIGYVSFHAAARFCNWLHNGATNGADTETGAYTLNGATSGVLPPRNPGAKYWLPSRKEWFKAAYYNPYAEDLNQYPMDLIQGRHQDGGYDSYEPGIHNWVHANYRKNSLWGAVNTRNGAYADERVNVEGYCVLRPCGSYFNTWGIQKFGAGGLRAWNTYGTFDMGGNVAEWTEDGGLRGGHAYDDEIAMDKDQNGNDWNGTAQSGPASTTGFRVASLAGQHTFHVTNGYIDVDLPGEIIAPFGMHIYKPDHQVSGEYDEFGDFSIWDDRSTVGNYASSEQRGYLMWPRWVGGWYPDGSTYTGGAGEPTRDNYWSVYSHDHNHRDGLPASGRYEYNFYSNYFSEPLNNYYITLKTVPAPAPSPIESVGFDTNGFSMSWLNKHAYARVQRSTSLTEGSWETIGELDTRSQKPESTFTLTLPYYRWRWDQAPKTFTDPAPPAGSAFYRIKVD